jgi:hypothetical protein
MKKKPSSTESTIFITPKSTDIYDPVPKALEKNQM